VGEKGKVEKKTQNAGKRWNTPVFNGEKIKGRLRQGPPLPDFLCSKHGGRGGETPEIGGD